MSSALRAVALAAVVVLSACSQPPVTEQMAGLAPYNKLHGVRVQMRVDELRRVRPGAVAAPYVGLSENVAGYQVGYSTPGLYSEEHVASRRDRIYSVTANSEVTTASVARAQWDRAVLRIGRIHGDPRRCYSTFGGRVRHAEWRRNGTSIAVRAIDGWAPAPNARGEHRPPSLSLEVQHKSLSMRVVDRLFSGASRDSPGNPIPCPHQRASGGVQPAAVAARSALSASRTPE